MNLTILDPHVSTTMNVFLSIANIINLIYNIPQMVKTYKTKSTKDFSAWFIFLRIFGNIIWIIYAIDIDSLQMLINNTVTVFASIFIGYYKCGELLSEYRKKKYLLLDKGDDILLDVEDGLMHVEDGLMHVEDGLMHVEDGLMHVEDGLMHVAETKITCDEEIGKLL